MLHLSKIAYGCDSLDVLKQRLDARAEGGTTTITTRYRPKRAEELVGGSLFWILQHRLVARQALVGFEEGEAGRCVIRLSQELVDVVPFARRSHQGWRYLEGAHAPPDVADGSTVAGSLPPQLLAELNALDLI